MCINELRKLGSVTENYSSLNNVQEWERYAKMGEAENVKDRARFLSCVLIRPTHIPNDQFKFFLVNHSQARSLLPATLSPFRSKRVQSRKSKVGLTRQKDSSASAATARGSGEEKRGEDAGTAPSSRAQISLSAFHETAK